ncbi:MAG: IclR family transcriptional regulator [Rhodovulum sulfidophilum]|uniref:IclR family transcriptional regulator n=1 Tax=Rhodovulum sulfidophilum TaxID=35806 RepID=A0A2W5N4Q4_RHOSU|nr:MAG: IclR family transcriptional regulator [Rhodovulum sulfidophilum]
MSALDDAIDMLACFSFAQTGLTQADLLRRTGVPKATASRVLRTLRDRGVLDYDPERRLYSVGVRLFELGQIYRRNHDFLSALAARVDAISRETGMTGYVTVFDGAELVILRMSQGSHPLAIFTPPGARVPCWSTSNGRAMLALLGDAEIRDRLPDPLPRVTEAAPATLAAVLGRVAAIRRAGGVESSRHETLEGVGSEGVGVRDPASGEIFGVAISYPDAAISEEERLGIAGRLRGLRRDFARLEEPMTGRDAG